MTIWETLTLPSQLEPKKSLLAVASILFAGWAREVLMCHGISPDRVGAAALATVTHRGRLET